MLHCYMSDICVSVFSFYLKWMHLWFCAVILIFLVLFGTLLIIRSPMLIHFLQELVNPCVAEFANFVLINSLKQFVVDPTRDNNILDLVLSNDPFAIMDTVHV